MENKIPFQGSFIDNCIEDAMPSVHVQFACMIEPVADIQPQLKCGASKTYLAVAQVL